MTTRELECFVATAKTRSFAKAAEMLFTSQSTVSYQIKHLEDELGFLLFERDNRVELTSAGRLMYESAAQLTDAWRKSVHAARLLDTQQRETLHIGMRRLMDEKKLAVLLDRFYHEQERYGFVLHMYRQGYFVSDLIQGNRDLIFADSMEIERNENIAFMPLCRSYSGYVVSKKHPLSRQKEIGFEDLRNEKLILPAVPPGTDESPHAVMIKRYCPAANISYSDCHENAVLCASAGVAISCVSYTVSQSDERVSFIPAAGCKDLMLGLAWRKNDDSPGVALFVKLAREVFSDGVRGNDYESAATEGAIKKS